MIVHVRATGADSVGGVHVPAAPDSGQARESEESKPAEIKVAIRLKLRRCIPGHRSHFTGFIVERGSVPLMPRSPTS